MSKHAPPSTHLFAIPDYVRLWSVGLVTFIVRWLEMLAVSLFVYHATGSAFQVVLVGMLRLLPMALFGAVMGAISERVEARNAVLGIVVISLATSSCLAVLAWTGHLAVWHLALASFVNGIAWTADNPVRRLMIGQVVGSARMGRAMSADIGSANASRMVGPTLGGVIFATVGIEGAFVASMALYLVALYSALTLRYRSGRQPASGQGVLSRIAEGIKVVRGDPKLKGVLVVTLLFNVFGWPFTSLIPVVGQAHLGLGAEATGVLASMEGVGAFVGALAMVAWARPTNYVRCYVGGSILYMAMITAFGLSPRPVLAGIALLFCGLFQAGFSTMQATLIYLRAPVETRGRILGLLTVCNGIGPLGFIHVGLLADAIGAHWACVVTGVEGLLALLLTRRWWKHC